MTQIFSTTPIFADDAAWIQNEQQLFTAWQKAAADEQNMVNIVIKLPEQIKVKKLESEN